MSGDFKVKIMVVAMIAFSLVSIALLTALSGPDKLVVRGIRFILTCVLGYFLIRGAPLARILAGVLFIIGAVMSLLGFFGLSSLGVPMLSLIGLWMLIMAAFYLVMSYFLFLDQNVAEHFS